MAECPCCFGEGYYDFRDDDARMAEQLANPPPPLGIVPCPECEGTGAVTEERAKDIAAWSVAETDRFLAMVKEKGL